MWIPLRGASCWRCQSNADLSMRCAICPRAIDDLRRKGAPFRRCGRASLLVNLPGDEMALLIEMVVDLGVNRAELLQRLHTSKPLHRPLSSSKRLMRILRPIVEAATDLVSIGSADLFHRRGIRAKAVGDDLPRGPYFFMIRFRSFSAAALSRLAVTTASKTSPSWSTARQR